MYACIYFQVLECMLKRYSLHLSITVICKFSWYLYLAYHCSLHVCHELYISFGLLEDCTGSIRHWCTKMKCHFIKKEKWEIGLNLVSLSIYTEHIEVTTLQHDNAWNKKQQTYSTKKPCINRLSLHVRSDMNLKNTINISPKS